MKKLADKAYHFVDHLYDTEPVAVTGAAQATVTAIAGIVGVAAGAPAIALVVGIVLALAFGTPAARAAVFSRETVRDIVAADVLPKSITDHAAVKDLTDAEFGATPAAQQTKTDLQTPSNDSGSH